MERQLKELRSELCIEKAIEIAKTIYSNQAKVKRTLRKDFDNQRGTAYDSQINQLLKMGVPVTKS